MSYACVPEICCNAPHPGHFVAVPDQKPLLQHTGMLPLLQQDGRQNWQFNYRWPLGTTPFGGFRPFLP